MIYNDGSFVQLHACTQFSMIYTYSCISVYMATCWRIRKLIDTPTVTLSTKQKRDSKRELHSHQELLIIQCANCKLILHRRHLPLGKLKIGGKEISQPVVELERVRARATKEGALLFCNNCHVKVATVGMAPQMKATLHSLTLLVPEAPDLQLAVATSREPYSMIGAMSGLSYHKIMGELQRLAYSKQSRYRLTMRSIGDKVDSYEFAYKGLQNLILVSENNSVDPIRCLPPPGRSSSKKIQFDKMMRSTTIDLSNSRNHSRSLAVRHRKRQDSPLPHKA